MTLTSTANKDSDGDTLVAVKGSTDDTPIGNTGDRFKVDALSSGSILFPSSPIVHADDFVKNAGSNAMNVNGSVTPVNFDYTPTETRYVDAIGLLIVDTASPDFNEFGSIGSALTNGLQIKVRTNGTEYVFANIQDNKDITLHFSGTYTTIPGLAGLSWLNETDFFLGFMTFRNALTLKNSTSDYVRLTVRDNLSGIDRLHGFVKAWRII